MKVGRPSKYNITYLEGKAEEYLESCIDEWKKLLTYKSIWKDGSYLERYEYKLIAKIPSVSWFASYIGVSRETLYSWSKKYSDFNLLIEHIKSSEMVRLINGGLSRRYNAQICCMRIKRLANWKII